ncbi:s4-like RNA-binding protein [Mycoplasmopsis bovigenitalium]|uniref:S4-like RNA-binding protein n=1 Tax=Mycoplasmopsis bovigenitalium TaxID=2112 RepID=A0A449A8D9_9BACT|nr:RNA-binding S4 domain-containing protein [Mycoplasmopsis bovigenitalium]VEU60416.1 s4-like RNA-binding protein [Mycoplasmopsis bovigenitalium]
MNNVVLIDGNSITLGQFLKLTKIISTGGQAKFFIETNNIKINNNVVNGRNTKIFSGDVVWINNKAYFVKN